MSRSRAELDTTVVNIELTLASIIQGVALYFLAENACTILSERNWSAGIYAAAGLFVIFVFWSRSIIHNLTLIKWLLEFGHNFFYIACALGEAMLFTCLSRPLDWFCLSTIYAGVVWLLFVYDMRLIQARLNESHGAVERALYTHARWRSVAEHFCAGPLALFQSRLHAGHLPRTKFFRQSRRTRLVDQRSIDFVYNLS